MRGSFWTWEVGFDCCQAGWRAGIRLQLRRIGGGWWLAPGLPGSDALSDDVAVVGGSEARADAEQGVEGRCGVLFGAKN